ncbi:MAG: PD40 domain-containing protein [Phycisphaerales bacterium]|nr:PD40 domain-containing protein [Phycisphaerales bacterium]
MNKDGRTFEQLTSFTGQDTDGQPLPDGSMLFLSSRDGQYNLYRLAPGMDDKDGAGAVTQLTFFKPTGDEVTIAHGVRDLAVSADGSLAVFVVWNTLYSLDLTRANADPVALDVELGADLGRDTIERLNLSSRVTEAAIHPSGDAVVVSARGELFVRSTKEGYPTRRITDTPYREGSLAWSPDGSVLYFSSDDADGLGTIYKAEVSFALEDLEPEPTAEPVEESADETAAESEEPAESADEQVSESTDAPAPGDENPDGGDEKGGSEEEKEPKVDYAKRWSGALRFAITPVVKSAEPVYAPLPSPDGTKLLYKRERGDVLLRDLVTGADRVLFESWSDPSVFWASDSRHIYYENSDLDFNTDIFILDTMPSEDGTSPEPVNISMHPDIDHSPRLSHDGKVMTFLSDRDNENWGFDVYAVYLDKSLEGMTSYALKEYFEEAAKAAKKLKPLDPTAKQEEIEPLEFDADDAYLRVRRLTSTPESESDLAMTPGGDRVLFSTVIDGSRSYVSVDHTGKDRKSVQSGGVSDVRVALDGSEISFVSGGQARKSGSSGGKVTTLGISASIDIDRGAERAQKFREAAGRFGQSFYHPTLKGLDWARITERYDELTGYTRTNQAFQRLMNLMFGEVDGSHTGIWGGDGFSASSPGNGYLGADVSPVESGYRIDRVLLGGAIDEMKDGPIDGDVIVAVNEHRLTGADTASGLADLHAALVGLSGDEVLLEYVHTDDTGASETRFGIVRPSSYGSASVMRYENEVLRRRTLVEERSGGRLGYLHIRSMGIESVRDFERDLYAAAHGKEGLVIDVRDNGGGWTTDILLASLTAPAHAYTIPRGANPDDVQFDNYPRDRRLIYAWNRPISVLINQNSFSNAEIFAHSIKTIGRGKLIGTQTFGGVISTGSFSLIDGTTVRRPFRGWYLPDGTDMESHGAMPDIAVSQTPMDEVRGIDRQLETAVDTMLKDLGTP